MCWMAQYTTRLLSQLSYEGEPCWYPVGGIEVATTAARLADLKRRHGLATAYGPVSYTHLTLPTNREV